jgi:hypothetical protein
MVAIHKLAPVLAKKTDSRIAAAIVYLCFYTPVNAG